MENQQEDIELRSEEVQDILGKVPHWITRYGSLFILASLFSIIMVAGFVKYPTLVKAPVEIVSGTPPIPLYSKVSGNIKQIFVQDNQEVKEDDVLAELDNAANLKDVLLIEQKIDSISKYPESVKDVNFPTYLNLGRLNSYYSDFISAYENFNYTKSLGVAHVTSVQLSSQIAKLRSLNVELLKQQANCKNELNFLQNDLNNLKSMEEKGLVSKVQINAAREKLSTKRELCNDFSIQIKNNELRIQELKLSEHKSTSSEVQNVQQNYFNSFEAANKLRSEIALWKQQYLLIAPSDGVVSFKNAQPINTYVSQNEEVLFIAPKLQHLTAHAFVPINEITKVKPNEEVYIQLFGYNYLEFGMLEGTVQAIQTIPRDGAHLVEIDLPKGLISTYNMPLKYSSGMQGTAEIISEKKTFLSRIFYTFKYLFTI